VDRSRQEIWGEITRTAELVRGYRPSLENLENKIATGELEAKDSQVLIELASDAEILAGLIEQLQHLGVTFDH
jgi:hypothetical protein